MANRDYYKVLGVKPGATEAEVKTAYRRMARKYHPDVSKAPDASRRFREATEAYEVLSDPQKRRMYDTYGQAGPGAPSGGTGPQWASGRPEGVSFDLGELFGRGGRGFMGMGLDDILEALGGGAAGRPSASSGRRARRGSAPQQRGQDAEYPITLDLVQAASGTTTRIRLTRPSADGQMQQETLDVKVPAGVRDGSRVRVRGKGRLGPGGAGDLYIVVRIRPHEYFEVRGDDVYVHLPVSIAEAALGARVDVPTIDGMTTVTIPAGSASSRRLRLRGKGLARPGGPRGDQYVVIDIVPPKQPTDRQTELLKEFARLDSPDPRANVPWK